MQRCDEWARVVNVVHLYLRTDDMRFRILVCLCVIDVMESSEKVRKEEKKEKEEEEEEDVDGR